MTGNETLRTNFPLCIVYFKYPLDFTDQLRISEFTLIVRDHMTVHT